MSDEKQSQKERKSGNKPLIIAGALVIAALLAVIAILLTGTEEKEEEPKRSIVVREENVVEVVEQMVSEAQEFVEPGYYTVNMNTHWHFAKGDAVSEDARVDNLPENTHDVYFDVFLRDDESEPIYQSPVIPRGGYLEKIVLDTALEPGTYECVIVYHLVNEDQETISTLRVAFQITVES